MAFRRTSWCSDNRWRDRQESKGRPSAIGWKAWADCDAERLALTRKLRAQAIKLQAPTTNFQRSSNLQSLGGDGLSSNAYISSGSRFHSRALPAALILRPTRSV